MAVSDNLIGPMAVRDNLIGTMAVRDNLTGPMAVSDNLIGPTAVRDNLTGPMAVSDNLTGPMAVSDNLQDQWLCQSRPMAVCPSSWRQCMVHDWTGIISYKNQACNTQLPTMNCHLKFCTQKHTV